jgi:hypothetical protein
MFTWICPKCGREVPPAYTDCPNCNPQTVPAGGAPPPRPYAPQPTPAGPAPRRPIWQSAPPQQQAPPYAAPPQQPYAAPPQQAYAPPPQAYAPTLPYVPPPQTYAPPPPPPEPAPAPQAAPWSSEPPPPARGLALPTWLLAILFTAAFGGLVAGAYWLFGSRASSSSQAASDTSLQVPVTPPGGKANPYQKFIEISGIRFAQDPKDKNKSIVKFVITNHADDDISGLSGTVAVLSRADKSGQVLGGFTFTTSLAGQESKDLTTPLTTKLKPYELPDWQFAQPMLQITAPGGVSGGSQ